MKRGLTNRPTKESHKRGQKELVYTKKRPTKETYKRDL